MDWERFCLNFVIIPTYRDDPDEEEGVEDEDDEHGSLHLPGVDCLLLHEEAVVPILSHLKVILIILKFLRHKIKVQD